MGTLSDIRPYFRTRMNALGYTEYPDGFGRDNIPETLLEGSYHIGAPQPVGGPVNYTTQDTNSSVSVAVFFRGYRDASEAIDASMAALDTIIKECCKAANAKGNGAGILNVTFDGAQPEPLSTEENENTVLLNIDFTVRVMMGIEE